jgi:hypothetical protein
VTAAAFYAGRNAARQGLTERQALLAAKAAAAGWLDAPRARAICRLHGWEITLDAAAVDLAALQRKGHLTPDHTRPGLYRPTTGGAR